MPLHPVDTTQRIRDAYLRYLKTIKPFQDSRLREEFSRALDEDDMLVKGPYIELTPPFKAGRPLQDLISEGLLSSRFRELCHEEGLRLDRPLYLHQEEAIRKIRQGRNIVITTGTGSGKTEAFLIPILDALVREEQAGSLGRAGVRALLLYPMNALANDQMERLRNYLAKFPHITFGRYVGETEASYRVAVDAFQNIHHKRPPANEMISREQMQEKPPHILLTNYAMLEYLLLRPDDTNLFDGETGQFWRFIVLDEAHAYDGAQATEIAMLLRRLQDRVTQGGKKQLQAIATSATLGEDNPESRAQVADFAHRLFNLDFSPEDVIFGQRLPESGLSTAWGSGTPELYAALHSLANAWREDPSTPFPKTLPDLPPLLWAEACRLAQMAEEKIPRLLYEVLKGDNNLHRLRRDLLDRPLKLRQAARQIFGGLSEEEAQGALANLISAAILARERPDKSALLPARYHLFARALEGAFVCLNHQHPSHAQEKKPLLFLTRQRYCPHCGSRVFELANCTRCGESYLIGDQQPGDLLSEIEGSSELPIDPHLDYLIQNSKVFESDLQASNVQYLVLEALEAASADEDALIEEEAESGEMGEEQTEAMEICPRCGAMFEKDAPHPRCKCGVPALPVARVKMGKKRTLERCVSCSTFSKGGVIYRFLTGQDAPVSVLAGTLYKDIPPAREPEERSKPGEGRKMLIFTDNRQRAAFFAPYLQRAQNRQLRRRLMVESLRHLRQEEPLRFSDWMDILLTYSERAGVFKAEESLGEKQRTIATWLMQEFSGLDKRLGLEGVGLMYFRPYRVPGWQPPEELLTAPWNLTSEEAYNVLAILLNTLRRQGAVSYLLEDKDIHLLDSAKKDEFLPRARLFYVRESHAETRRKFGIYSWTPTPPFNNSRCDFLARLLAQRKGEKQPSEQTRLEAAELLHSLWCYLTLSRLGSWLASENIAEAGTIYRLKHTMWEVIPTLESTLEWYICDRCQNLSAFNTAEVCPTYSCRGKLRPLSEHEYAVTENIYRFQYAYEVALPFSAMEHTAQWKAAKAAEIQKQFIRGDYNALSCSTTFEMGVDVGDLNAVVLRNVPPSAANYIQRAGRAGRRTDSIAMVVTFAQRRQHDLTFYAEPERMIAGKLRPPIVPLKNDKIIRRHLHSVVFAAFLRWAKESYGCRYRNTGDFFAPENQAHNGPRLLTEFLAARPPELQEALLRVTPREDPTLAERLRLNNWGWLPFLCGSDEAVLDKAAENISAELNEFRTLEQQAVNNRDYDRAKEALKIQETIRKRDLLGYLGSKNVLPKYGFPTDVVPLQTDHLRLSGAGDIELERDLKLAISEFAPGGQIVAAGKIWYSRGIKQLPGRSWVPYGYAVCPVCQRINIQTGTQIPRQCQCGKVLSGSGVDKVKEKGVYITPEYGFIADNKTDVPGEQPPERIYSSRIYLAAYQASSEVHTFDPDNIIPDPDFDAGVRVLKGYTRYAYLGLVNHGKNQGFKVCPTCGFSDVIDPSRRQNWKRHQNPQTHEICTEPLTNFHLGHHFMTDVLQLRIMLPIEGESAVYSLLYAILNGASDALEIPRSDIDGLVFYQGDSPSFILYDTTPGGSGHVELINNNLRRALEGAYRRVARCDGCGRETSCYSCLRGYNNQFVHDLLVRGIAEDLLATILGITR